MLLRLGCFAVISLLAASGVAAADRAEVERGRLLAEQLCGRCHATGETGASPHKITPPFRALSERFPVEMLVEALSTGEISGHDEMPMFVLDPADMRALLAHIDNLNQGRPGYLDLPRK